MLNESYDPNEPQLFVVNSVTNAANEVCDFQYTRRRFLEMAGLAVASIAILNKNILSEEQIKDCIVNTTKLNMRSGQSISYPIIDTLIQGERVTIIEFNADQSWCNVTGPRVNGWVLVVYLKCANVATETLGWGYLFNQAPAEVEICSCHKDTPKPLCSCYSHSCSCDGHTPCSYDSYTPCSCDGHTPCSCDNYVPPCDCDNHPPCSCHGHPPCSCDNYVPPCSCDSYTPCGCDNNDRLCTDRYCAFVR